MTDSSSAPAGWYPQDDGRQRYWDGDAWTEHFAPGTEDGTGTSAAQEVDEDALWQVRGQPLTGIGAGRFKLTERHLFFEVGTLRTDSQQIPIDRVTDVDVKQTMSQKARSVANLMVHVDRGGGIETVVMADVPDFREGQRLINQTSHDARLALQRHQNTMRYEHSGGAAAHTSAADPSLGGSSSEPTGGGQPGGAADPIELLERLGKLRDAGVVSPEEFEAKKAEILSRI